jgi:hypothetical protein
LRKGGAVFFSSHVSIQTRLSILPAPRENQFTKHLFGTAPPDPRLGSGAGAVPNRPSILPAPRENQFTKHLFGTAPPDPRLGSGAGAVPNRP